VVNAIVYVGSEDGNLYALDVGTGALVWQYATGSAVDSSPAVANGVVYCANPVLPGRRWAEITDSGPTQDRQKTNVTALRKVILTTDLKNLSPGATRRERPTKSTKLQLPTR
jgi:outer membrane protein assembly factor BamB